MPKQTLRLTHEELAEVIGAVGGQNGLTVTGFGLIKDGKLVEYDEAVLEIDSVQLKVRSTPEDDLASMIKKRYANFLLEPYEQQTAEEN